MAPWCSVTPTAPHVHPPPLPWPFAVSYSDLGWAMYVYMTSGTPWPAYIWSKASTRKQLRKGWGTRPSQSPWTSIRIASPVFRKPQPCSSTRRWSRRSQPLAKGHRQNCVSKMLAKPKRRAPGEFRGLFFLSKFGSAWGIRTPDLRLERAVSWAARRMRHSKKRWIARPIPRSDIVILSDQVGLVN